MTAEIVVMNREAVALAADSAVTIGDTKIFSSANKIFRLAPNLSIGLLIYNNAQFMGLPWEIIIKSYRQYVEEEQPEYETLSECADDFLTFLLEKADKLYPEQHQIMVVQSMIAELLAHIAFSIDEQVKEIVLSEARKVELEEIESVVNQVITDFHVYWSNQPDRYQGEELEAFREDLLENYSDFIFQIIPEIFEQRPLSDDNYLKLKELSILILTKDKELPYYSGLVFAGFGTQSLFPECISFHVDLVTCNKLKYKRQSQREAKIELSGSTGAILPYAQRDEVFNFLEGIHPVYLDKFEKELPQEITNSIIRLIYESEDLAQKEEIAAILLEKAQNHIRDLLYGFQQEVGKQHVDTILQTLNVLPKDELASMAETLVTLTSFKRRISMSIESVGGPIDVAVISKKDGFIWIKRKHYFEPELNYQFFADQ